MQNYNATSAGQTAYGNATGANGPKGTQQAIAAFESSPQLQSQLQLGDNAVAAQEAKSGQTLSGNAAVDLSNYNNNVLQQGYGNYVQSLQPYLGAVNSAAQGVAGVNMGLGSGLNANQNTLGNAIYGANTSIGNANANAALSGLGASANMLGALGGGLGLGAQMLGFLSDERAKDDIEPVGELYDGQKIFRYRYKGDHRHTIGLIAQDVEREVPGATFDIPEIGMKGVNYHMATSRAAELGRFLEAA